MAFKRLETLDDDGYDDPYKQDSQCVDCSAWTRGHVSRVCLSSAVLVVIGIAVLISIASWAYVSMITSSNSSPIRKTDRTKLFTDKGDLRSSYMKTGDLPEISSDPIALAPILPGDIGDMPSIGSSAAIPDGPFALTGADSAPDKPYIIPAQPNDLNLDLIDDSPGGGENGGKGEGFLSHKLEKEVVRGKSKFMNDVSHPAGNGKHNIHIIDLTSDDNVKQHVDKLSVMPSLSDTEPPNKHPGPHEITGIGRGVNKPHEVRKVPLAHPMDMEPPEIVPMTLYRIHSAAKTGSVCLDGSVPAYYHRPGVGSSERLWIIHFNGGAWCFDAKACFERAHSSLGSTNKLPASPPIIQGINSPDPTVNPDFHDWNLVWVVYCDGASFTGDQDRPLISESGDTIYMRGKRVLNAIIADVLKNRNMKDAEAVVLTGSSAGSMTAIFQADYIASKLPKTIPVRVFSDAGFFIDTSSIGGKNLNEVFKDIYEMQNSSAGLHQDCIRDVGIKKGWQCFFPAKAVNYVKTPVFVLNSLYDIWALMYFIGINCKFPVVRPQERKKRSLYKDYIFPEDSELELPELSEEASRTYNLFLDRKRKRDISGFEIFPFFRTPTYLESDAPEKAPEKRVDVEASTGGPKSKTVSISAVADTKDTLPRVLEKDSDAVSGPITTAVELSDVLSDLSNSTGTRGLDNSSSALAHHPQIKAIKSMLNDLKDKVSNEQFSAVSANMAASLQHGLNKKDVTPPSIHTNTTAAGTSNNTGAANATQQQQQQQQQQQT